MNKSEIQQRLRSVILSLPAQSHVRRVSLFGSHLHGTARDDSDIDLLVEFHEPVSMFTFVRLENDISRALGRKVDLSTPNSLSRYFRNDVVREAESLVELPA